LIVTNPSWLYPAGVAGLKNLADDDGAVALKEFLALNRCADAPVGARVDLCDLKNPGRSNLSPVLQAWLA
jgi:hypothetical protein